jgi:hypothetical protein
MRAHVVPVRLVATAVLPALSTTPGAAQRTPSHATRAMDSATVVTRLADAYVARFAAAHPEDAAFSGLPDAPADRFTDYRLAAVRRYQVFEDSVWAVLRTLPVARLEGMPDEVTYAQLREALEASRGLRVCHQELWMASAAFGWQAAWAQRACPRPEYRPTRISRC